MTEGCAGDCSKAYHVAIPVLVQYAFDDRARGAYVEGGLNFLPTYGASTDTEKHPEQSPESLRVSGFADVKLGFGYRLPLDGFRKGYVFELHAGLDVGKFDSVAYTNVRGSVEGDIADAERALHYVASLSVGWHFAP